MKTYVGIDLGACDIKAAKISPQIKRIQPIKLNMNIARGVALPSAILYDEINGEVEVKIGDSARASVDIDNKISHLTPKLARKSWSKFIPNLNRRISAAVALTDMFAKIWRNISNQAARNENFDVTITVPAAFSDVQKKIIRQAAINADIPISTIITAPFAEIFSCDELIQTDSAQIVLIFDFGGTMLDINLFKIAHDKNFNVTELSAANLNYGGLNIDYAILRNVFMTKYTDKVRVFLTNPYELMTLIESMKKEIFIDEEDISTGSLIDDRGKLYEFELTRQEIFNAIDRDGIKPKIISMLDDLLDDAGISADKVNVVKVFGGTSATDYFLDILQNYFGDEIFDGEIERDEITLNAAIGAAKYRELTDEENLRVKVKSYVSGGIYIQRGEKFFRCIKRNELRGFMTPYKPLYIDELIKNHWRLSIYQSLSNEVELSAESGDAIYIGDVKLNSHLYNSEQAILFKMKINAKGQLCIKFFEDDKSKINLIEEKVLALSIR